MNITGVNGLDAAEKAPSKPLAQWRMNNEERRTRKTITQESKRRAIMNSDLGKLSVNTQIVESIIQLIRALPRAERELLEQRLAAELPELTTQDLMVLADQGGSFDFWHDEPEIYTFADGEPIQW
jgi:hypothetical protein